MTSRRSRLQLRPNIKRSRDNHTENSKDIVEKSDLSTVPTGGKGLNDSSSNVNNQSASLIRRRFIKPSPALPQRNNVNLKTSNSSEKWDIVATGKNVISRDLVNLKRTLDGGNEREELFEKTDTTVNCEGDHLPNKSDLLKDVNNIHEGFTYANKNSQIEGVENFHSVKDIGKNSQAEVLPTQNLDSSQVNHAQVSKECVTLCSPGRGEGETVCARKKTMHSAVHSKSMFMDECDSDEGERDTHTALESGILSSATKSLCMNTEKSEVAIPSRNKSKNSDKRGYNKKRKPNPQKEKITMLDLIYSNFDDVNTKKKSRERKGENTTVTKDYQSVCNLRNEVVSDTHGSSEADSASPHNSIAPRVMIDANGEITIDESSLIIQRTVPNLDEFNVIYEDRETTNYASFRKKHAVRAWPKKESARFYKALHVFGTDFSLMSRIFPDRTRHDLKLKFKREERKNESFVEKALGTPPVFDLTLFDSNAEDEMDEELTDKTSNHKKKNNKRKQTKHVNEKNVGNNEKLGEKKRPTKKCVPNHSNCCAASSNQEVQGINNTGTNHLLQQVSLPVELECHINENSENQCSTAHIESDELNASTCTFLDMVTTDKDAGSSATVATPTERNNCLQKNVLGSELAYVSNSRKNIRFENKINTHSSKTQSGHREQITSCIENLENQNGTSSKIGFHGVENVESLNIQCNLLPSDMALENVTENNDNSALPLKSPGLIIIGPNEKKLLFPKSLISSSVKFMGEELEPIQKQESEIDLQNMPKKNGTAHDILVSENDCEVNHNIAARLSPQYNDTKDSVNSDKLLFLAGENQAEASVVHVFIVSNPTKGNADVRNISDCVAFEPIQFDVC